MPAPFSILLQPLLMHIRNLQIFCLFAQLTNPGHIRCKMSPVTIKDTDCYSRPLPLVMVDHLGNQGIETVRRRSSRLRTTLRLSFRDNQLKENINSNKQPILQGNSCVLPTFVQYTWTVYATSILGNGRQSPWILKVLMNANYI